jgi:hypothetical protein
MANDRQQPAGQEDGVRNNQEEHDPAEAGKKAIEASKLANDKDIPASQKKEEEEKDADQWRNEG